MDHAARRWPRLFGRLAREDRARVLCALLVAGFAALNWAEIIRPTPLLFADLHAFEVLELVERPALLIGADLLYRFREVTLDFGRSRMAFRGLRRLG